MSQCLEKLFEKTRKEYTGYQKTVKSKLNDPITIEYHVNGDAKSAITVQTNVLGILFLLAYTYRNPELFNGWDNGFQDDLADISSEKPFIIPTEGMDWISGHINALREAFGANNPKQTYSNTRKVYELLVEGILSDFRVNAGLMYDDERRDELFEQLAKPENQELVDEEADTIAVHFLNGIGTRTRPL